MKLSAQVEVSLGARSYPVHIGTGLLSEPALFRPAISGAQVALITNDVVEPLYAQAVLDTLSAYDVAVHVLPDGESFKSFAQYERLLDFLMRQRHNRTTTLVALGGGVVGDITGFAAATFQRGVDFVQVPTTLLAQVDSSVGGKTAINHPLGKNMVGAFYQPQAVIADMSVLATLPAREYRAGLAEVIKYGVITDPEFFAWCEANVEGLRQRDAATLAWAVQRCVELKAAVVAADETEQGQRAILNFGHTFGHAVEAVTEYSEYLHGEAVAVGMVAAACLSQQLGRCDDTVTARLVSLLAALELPVAFPSNLSQDAVLDAMGMDKKVVDGRLRFIVVDEIGKVQIDDKATDTMVRSAIAQAVNP